MALISTLFNCFVPSSSPPAQVSDSSQLNSKSPSTEKPKSKSAPIVVSYFPVNHYPSRL
ncbi:hypothetical protein Fmac_018458 [Flemingia macrophylla]|uniref:Uncharacterized protein n=1 Tax=Flemingia macrophylla TaxID=520843 RepID=A0ABD1M519_9FABA